MTLKYSNSIKTSLLMMFFLGASLACQTQDPLLRKTPASSGTVATSDPPVGKPSSVKGRTVFRAEESDEGKTERMEVISTPFGLVKVRARGPEPSTDKSAPEEQTVSQELPTIPKSEA